MPRRNAKRRTQTSSPAQVDDDEIVVDDDEQYEWLTSQIQTEASSKSKSKTKYDAVDVCVIGLERLINDVGDEEFHSLQLPAVEAKLTLARMYYEKFHSSLVDSIGNASAKVIMQRTDRMNSIEKLYRNLTAALFERVSELKAEEVNASTASASATAAASQVATSINSVNVKKLEIEPFAGDIRKWPQFKSMFLECFHNQGEYSNTVKFYHLMSHLVVDSEAYKTIAALDRTEENYTSAWKMLCEAYDNDRKIVNDIVTSFIDMQPIKKPSRAALIDLINNTNSVLQSLPKYGVEVKHWGPIMVPLLVRKLDAESAAQWAIKRDKKKIDELKPLLAFMRDRADGIDSGNTSVQTDVANSVDQNCNVVSQNGHFRGPNSNNYQRSYSTDSSGQFKHDPRTIKRTRSCYHCKGYHQIFDCISFKRLPFPERESRLSNLGICIKCLRRGHTKADCKIRSCGCGGDHNEKLLCPTRAAANLLSVIQSSDVMDIGPSLIATIKLFASDSSGDAIQVRAMSDGGSHMCMISDRLVQQLKLKPSKLMIPLQGAGQYDIRSKSYVDLKISPADNGSSDGEWIRAGVLNTISSKLPLKRFDISDWTHLNGLPLADTKFNEPDDIDILLSVEFMARIEADGIRRDDKNRDRPIARNTSFGWIVYGALPPEYKSKQLTVSHVSIGENQQIAENVERLWKLDEVSELPLMTEEEQLCTQIFNDTVSRSTDGRYIVTMPIKPNAAKLGNSLKAAMARQFANERRFRKDPELKQKYVDDIQQFIDLDHIELVPFAEIDRDSSEIYYIPHHAANSSKFRVVFDGSVKTSTGVSLNDILLNGPRLQEHLPVIVMRFRTHRVALTTDITKMYRQVMVPECQRDLLRIVWRPNENEPLKHYRMKRQTYGLKSSAYCCVAALCKCAKDYADTHPLASKAVLQSFYVDDGTLGANSDSEAEELYRQLNAMLSKGGFPLAKWATNSVRMQSIIGATATSVNLDLFNESSVLGIKWSVPDDSFKYGLCVPIPNQPPTKRFIVASVARLFDPNGWIAPIVVVGKVLIQDIWRTDCDWDTVVPQHIQDKWYEFRNALEHLSEISIPRWLGTSLSDSIQIHGFADASAKSYGICFYVRVQSSDAIKCNLVIAKTKVAPLRGMSIPRLELCAVLMLAKACKQVCETHGVAMHDVTLWTDSSIVIHWLSKCPTELKTFVARRIADVQDLTAGGKWKHVKTHDNPADLASRGVLASELVNNSLWFCGPKWLCDDEENWPVSQFVVDDLVKSAAAAESLPLRTMTMVKKEIVPRIQHGDEMLIDYCSSMFKLVRISARVLRFINSITVKRERKRFESLAIHQQEYLDAQCVWIRHHQEEWFASELNSIREGGKSNGNVSVKSPLLKMTPFIDGHGVLRVGGRIKRSLMPYDTKHPIIIHGDSRFALLLAREAHATTLHGGTQLCMQYIRQRFWILNVRKTIRKIALKCVRCFRQRKEVADQLMGDLPSVRVMAGHAFESVGVDYFGPVEVRERIGRGKKTYKAYVALFICMKSKGVHLEMVTDLTTDAFMACLSRVISLRGRIHEIFSDNATTFHGAANEIKAIHAHFVEVANSAVLDPIKWTFITPLSPSQGGLWERAVRSAKHHLRRVIGMQVLTYDEYDTLLANVSACLNSRPLIVLDDDPETAQAITPAHLMIGRAIVGPLQYNYVNIPDNRLERWRLIQKLSQQFWSQWQQEVVNNQIERSKWRIKRDDVKVGAVVLVKTDNMPPTHWPLARVIAVFPGDDGRVRNVEIKMGSSTYRRCVSKIAVLPIDDDDDVEEDKTEEDE